MLDADEGQLILRPDTEVLRQVIPVRAQEAREAREAQLRRAPRTAHRVTADGHEASSLMLNIGLAMEMEQIERTGAAGIGLFRTEIAMLARGEIADVADQAALYTRVLDAGQATGR